jgi:ADP-ribosylglycohydrolase
MICCAAMAEIASQAARARQDNRPFSARAIAQAFDHSLERSLRATDSATQTAATGIESLAKTLHSFSEGFVDLDGALKEIGCESGISPYIVHTLLGSLLISMAFSEDIAAAIDTAIRSGGDTDSTAAIVAGLIQITSPRTISYERLNLWNTRTSTNFSKLDPGNPWLHISMVILGFPLLIRKNLARLRALL